MNREAILYKSNYNGVVFTTIMENCNGKVVTDRSTVVIRNSCEMCCDTFKSKGVAQQKSVKTVSQSIMLEWHCGQVFLIKIRKLKKGPLRGTPHNLSKVSLEVKELEITSKYTATSKQS